MVGNHHHLAFVARPSESQESRQGKRWVVSPHGVRGSHRSSPTRQGLPVAALEPCAQDLGSTSGLLSFIVFSLAPVNCKSALAKSTCQRPNDKNEGICHLPLWDWALCLSLNTHWGRQGGVRCSVPQESWWDRTLDGCMFLGTDFIWAQSLHRLIYREALNPFMMTSDPCDEQKTSCKVSPSLHWIIPSPKLYIPSQQSLRLTEVLPPGLQSSRCPK